MNELSIGGLAWNYFRLSWLIIGTGTAAVIALVQLAKMDCRWSHVVIFVVTVALTRVGITLFNHRYFTHRSFKFTVIGQYTLKPFLAFGAAIALQGPVAWWAKVHLLHHEDVDEHGKDPHTPIVPSRNIFKIFWGFLWAHMLWMPFARPDMKAFYRKRKLDWLERIYSKNWSYFVFGSGLAVLASYLIGGWQGIVWYFAAVCLMLHVTWGVNSFSHLIGSKMFRLKNHSTNCWPLLIFSAEYLHNCHHRFPGSARFAHRLWQRFFDPEYLLLVMCSHLGRLSLVCDIRRPSAQDVSNRLAA